MFKFKRILTPLLIILLLFSVIVYGTPTYVNLGPTSEIEGDIKIISEIVAEGTTANEFETTLFFTDPTADRIITFPNSDQTLDLSLYYLKTAVDTQAEMESIWGVDLANNSDLHAATTVTTINGLSIAGQEISLQAASTNTHGALTDTDWNTFNGKQDALTFGIADTNKVQINQADVASNDYAKFTTTGLSGRSYSEVLSDLGIDLSLYYLKTAIDTKAEMDAIWGVTIATTANKLSAFAATTSAELAGVISNETGTDKLVYNTSPTIYLPVVKGTTASDLPTYSAEFLDADNWTSTDWTGSWAAGWKHPTGTIETISLGSGGTGYTALDVITVVQAGGSIGTVRVDTVDGSGVILTCTRIDKGSGYTIANGLAVTGGTGNSATINILTINNTIALSHNHNAVSTTKYQIAYTVTGWTAGTFTVTFGGQSEASISATGAFGPTATTTGVLTITPTTDFDGTIVISIKSITAVSTPVLAYQSSEGTVRTEVRANTGLYNTFIGTNAGAYNTTGDQNAALGYQAFYSNTTGRLNTALGMKALYSNTTGDYNIALGMKALYSNTTGDQNAALGMYALYSNTTGYQNAALGYQALYSNTTGYQNAALGINAGRYQADGSTTLTTAKNSLYFGYAARGYNNNDDNTIVIGCNAIGLGANMVTLGNDSITRTVLKGNVMIGLNANVPTARLHLPAGTATASTAPLKFTSGTVNTTAETGAVEYNGTSLFFTRTGTVRETIGTVLTKTDTGDPTGAEGLFCINTYDNTFKVYADGGWRSLATW